MSEARAWLDLRSSISVREACTNKRGTDGLSATRYENKDMQGMDMAMKEKEHS